MGTESYVRVCSHDAARLGKPVEETEVFEVTSHGMNFTTILQNQAHTCNSLLLHTVLCRCNAIPCCCIQYLVVAFKFFGFSKWVCGRNNAITMFCKFSFATSICCIFWCRCTCRQLLRLCSVMQALPECRRKNTLQDGSLTKQGSRSGSRICASSS